MSGDLARIDKYFFQTKNDDGEEIENKEEEYAGPERRDHNRSRLSPQLQTVVDILRNEYGSCRKNCVIPEDIHKLMPQIVEVLRKAGEGNLAKGLSRIEDFYQDGNEIIKTWKDAKKRALNTIIGFIAVAILGALGIGVLTWLKG